ncbi:serine protease inhibitor 88Ea [Lucilia cuprina]|uniref:serine protease inhibitor 88Ea n=1 Tax=Lucilia cuprina TaxID=7375 RepID=UPI001F06DC6D|nr:serine protease inhibitor 88Ea [Lucilia cuprina]
MKLFLTGFLCTVLVAFGKAQDNGCFSANDVGAMPKNIRSELYRGQQEFTLAMLEAIQKATPNENVFFSPYSTFHALLLAYFGANGNTEKELVQALRLQWAKNKKHINNAYRLEKQTRFTRAKNSSVEFASADKIYFDKSINVSPCLSENFPDELEKLDFRNNAEASRMSINHWIAEITRNEIPEMLNPGDVTTESEMVLANAAYFKGQWSDKFDPKDTKQEIFYTSPSQHSFVPMMHKRGTFNLAIDEQIGAHVLQMPYMTSNDENKDSDISMVIILPPFQSGLDEVLSKLKPDTLENALKDSMPREIDISLPKFKFEQNLELVPILRKLGINSLFEHNADLSGFSAESQLKVGDAKHVAKIKVDEEGSTAAAATVLFSFRSARPVEPTKFECNHPFLFLIYDHTSKAVLFTGIYRDPKTQK